jgi:hypothetical protein
MAEAKKVLAETTSGAEGISYSFLQEASKVGSQIASSVDLANFEAVLLVQGLARKQQSTALAELAQWMTAAIFIGRAPSPSRTSTSTVSSTGRHHQGEGVWDEASDILVPKRDKKYYVTLECAPAQVGQIGARIVRLHGSSPRCSHLAVITPSRVISTMFPLGGHYACTGHLHDVPTWRLPRLPGAYTGTYTVFPHGSSSRCSQLLACSGHRRLHDVSVMRIMFASCQHHDCIMFASCLHQVCIRCASVLHQARARAHPGRTVRHLSRGQDLGGHRR